MRDYGKRKEWPVPTPEECLQSCLANAERSQRQLAHWKAEYDRLPPSDPGLQEAVRNVSRATSDEKHWRSLAEYHRRQLVAATCEGADMAGPEPMTAVVVSPDGRTAFVDTEVTRRERVPGEDDDDSDPSYDGWRKDVRRTG